MAVYYKWIKGCSSGANLDSGLWTYLKWGSGTAGLSVSNLPHIYTYTGKQDNPETENDLGYILTNNATDVSVNNEWSFKNTILVNKINVRGGGDQLVVGDNKMSSCKIGVTTDINENNTSAALIVEGGAIIKKQLKILTSSSVTTDLTVGKDLMVGNNMTISGSSLESFKTSGGIVSAKAISSGGSCSATFFNATSDIRAKENIKPATYSALELINKLSIYTYNYKNQNETVTGIMAQDLLENQPKELDLVSNINATGINNDYMSIKNDKLMFVLMKAIQEQQEEIKHLKEEIKRLSNK